MGNIRKNEEETGISFPAYTTPWYEDKIYENEYLPTSNVLA